METDWIKEAGLAKLETYRLEKEVGNADGGPIGAILKVALELVELRRVFCLGMAGDQEEDNG